MGEKMKKQNLALFYGCFCSILFALFYYLLFAFVYRHTLHINYLQVGIYQQATSLEKCQNKLKKLEIASYTIKKDENVYVVCGFEKYDEVKKKLTKEKIKYLEKQMTIKTEEQVGLWQQGNYQEVLERMYQNESKGNGDG